MLDQPSHRDRVSTRTIAFFIQEKYMLTMTATQSGSNELERLLAVIGARKDQAAFAALYSTTKRKLFSTVLLIVKRSDLAEEIIQEAYVRIWHSASSYRSSRGSPMTWMITIARNLAIDMVRKPAREIYSDGSELLELPADGPTAHEIIEDSEDQQRRCRNGKMCFPPCRLFIQQDAISSWRPTFTVKVGNSSQNGLEYL